MRIISFLLFIAFSFQVHSSVIHQAVNKRVAPGSAGDDQVILDIDGDLAPDFIMEWNLDQNLDTTVLSLFSPGNTASFLQAPIHATSRPVPILPGDTISPSDDWGGPNDFYFAHDTLTCHFGPGRDLYLGLKLRVGTSPTNFRYAWVKVYIEAGLKANCLIKEFAFETEWDSSILCGETSTPIGIEKLNRIQPLKLYPNPASNKIYLEDSQNIDGQIQFYSLSGNLLDQRRVQLSGKTEIDVSQLENGQIIMVITSSDGYRRFGQIRIERD